ncbi:MAG TPA: YqgE/AlgH family protein [Sediminibacterium sp.]|uniref:YqgE/AlgH family protein n=1 Tax=Sediminibacterium sp. TaxID=1917865 RepID=UPI0008AE4428|nr:YqgE/AlgH family protein [Sediminibacterium sp.]OHC84592.1 MAG: hypothetical protein A2472_11575 [Sphingobacteriia bacterium RIFOXYC2_FULL_35_18]OHC87513.1 MAG: hypothetical protein A2546_07990 [Sphingobacteriia bacterium RIFOXYD2_FULL_35_12]HLD53024.1 YqgE/AlgH family protein [Sediminibacterium sp.]
MELNKGILLLSDPFLKDPNFIRTAVLICDHNEEGDIGFILNKKTDQILGDVVEIADGLILPVYEGGPVEQHTLHFIHRRPDIITEGIEISKGIYWGGDFDVAIAALHNKEITDLQIRFFVGYSGWSAGQLQEEVEEKSWIITTPDVGISFSLEAEQIWKRSMQQLGGEYAQMTNYPIDPQLN